MKYLIIYNYIRYYVNCYDNQLLAFIFDELAIIKKNISKLLFQFIFLFLANYFESKTDSYQNYFKTKINCYCFEPD